MRTLLFLIILFHSSCDLSTAPNNYEPTKDAATAESDFKATDIRSSDSSDLGDVLHADSAQKNDSTTKKSLWSVGYYAGWQQNYLPPDKIDYAALTHVIHFCLFVKADGTFDDKVNSLTAANSSAAVAAAHAAGKKILLSVGGGQAAAGFKVATTAANRANFISSLVNMVSDRGYDGLDLDWEPLESADQEQFASLVNELRAALINKNSQYLFTVAVGGEASIIAPLHSQVDHVHVMTYDLSGAWPGWLTWHNSPIFDGGCKFVSTGGLVPSADKLIAKFIAAGVPAAKLGIGIDFYGYVWSGGTGTSTGGVTRPCQTYATAPTVTDNISYHQLMDLYYSAPRYVWDASAQAAYLSIDNADSLDDKFISYDDEATVANKVAYARDKGLGGVFIWELGGGYRANQPAGQQDLLLQALKKAAF